MVTINGEKQNAAGLTIGAFLDREGYDRTKVVVELNLEILAKDQLDAVTMKEEDSVEILQFVGGG